ncbi:MAG: hypothetical protein WCZ43_01950 [Proteiniphilum sp.]
MYKYLIICVILVLSCQFNNKNGNEQSQIDMVQQGAFSLEDSLSAMVESPKDSCSEITILSKTTDQLYMDSAFYFMIKSPLDFFNGYKNIYDDYPEVQTIELKVDLGAVLVLTLDNKYQCFWWLKEGMLYLSDITFFTVNRDQVNKVFPNKEHYELMENLTKVRFDRKVTSLPNIYGRPSNLNSEGMMPASWFSDTLLVKEVKKTDESYEEWNEKVCTKLVFKNGKLEKIE